jgi:hypothetical protein
LLALKKFEEEYRIKKDRIKKDTYVATEDIKENQVKYLEDTDSNVTKVVSLERFLGIEI